jgi:D-alanine-D-alanine ligase
MSEIDFSAMPPGHWPILSFDAKWTAGCPEDAGSRPMCPAKLHPALARRIRAIAAAAWRAVRGYGYGRVDMRVDAKGQPWVLEVNPNPDISDDAGLSRMAQSFGWSYDDLILRIADLALRADRRPVPVDQTEAALEIRTA